MSHTLVNRNVAISRASSTPAPLAQSPPQPRARQRRIPRVPPQFHPQAYPADTAPRENTFQPQNAQEIPGQALNPDATAHAATHDFPGATSVDVHAGLGKPVQGQTSAERHGANLGRRDKESVGLEGVGTSGKDNFR
ncbi:hypothetical protein CORC01_05370 [Colletotrichum orchidophilum]|uniref:Uncharacterized protein n=1 Tax=Colletotrichum orchidophilum TaxID=1209926 RepID=A0A1G4BD26_9PEZI|nr:uncharacterized protein CORC01_05370 [Colletotrichum orchidophilum]OHE99329.1 hypothetical protein CORC01_05370 [Colletotrichum orchidophilum]